MAVSKNPKMCTTHGAGSTKVKGLQTTAIAKEILELTGLRELVEPFRVELIDQQLQRKRRKLLTIVERKQLTGPRVNSKGRLLLLFQKRTLPRTSMTTNLSTKVMRIL